MIVPTKLKYEPDIKSVYCYMDSELNVPLEWSKMTVNQVLF